MVTCGWNASLFSTRNHVEMNLLKETVHRLRVQKNVMLLKTHIRTVIPDQVEAHSLLYAEQKRSNRCCHFLILALSDNVIGTDCNFD